MDHHEPEAWGMTQGPTFVGTGRSHREPNLDSSGRGQHDCVVAGEKSVHFQRHVRVPSLHHVTVQVVYAKYSAYDASERHNSTSVRRLALKCLFSSK